MSTESHGNVDLFGRLLRQTGVLFTSQVGRVLMGVVKASLIARALGPSLRGVYGLAVTVPLFVVGFGSLGIAPAVLYFVARRKYEVRRVLGGAMVFVLVVGPMLAAIGYLLIRNGVFRISGKGALDDLVWLVVASIPLALSSQIVSRFLSASGKITLFGATMAMGPTAQLVLFLVLCPLFADPLGAAVWSWLASYAAIILLASLLLIPLKAYPPQFHAGFIAEGLKYGLSSYVAQCCELAMFRLDFVFIAHFLDARSLGLYAVATQVAEMMRLLPEAVVTPFVPMLFGLSEGEQSKLAPTVVRVMTVLVVLMCATVAAVSGPLVRLLFGTEYREAQFALLYLLPGIASLSIYYFLRFQLFGRNMAWDVSKRAACGVSVSIALYLLLIPRWGISGAAIASSASYTLTLILVVVLYRRTTGCRITDLLFIKGSDLQRVRSGIQRLRRRRRPDSATISSPAEC